MCKKIFFLLTLISTLIYGQGKQTDSLSTSPAFSRMQSGDTDLLNYENEKQSSKPDKDSTLFTPEPGTGFELKTELRRIEKPVLNKIALTSSGIWNSPYKEIPMQLETKIIYLPYRDQPTKLTKFALSQMLFAGMGALDYAVKEAPMYPGYRKDTFFWQSAWGTMVWSTSIGLNMLVVKDFKYILGLLTEDMSYYLCRQVFHKQNFPVQFGLPFKVMGVEQVPMRTMLIIWAASVTYLALDALELF
jgi:hypothetical protein